MTFTILGDSVNELDENYYVILSNPVNATIQDPVGEVTILNDDAVERLGMELTHGGLVVADLAGHGPDREPGLLSRPAGAVHVVGSHGRRGVGRHRARAGAGAPGGGQHHGGADRCRLGTGSAQALRWQRRAAIADTRPFIRVRSTGCTTACGPDDIYRLRAYETTATIPRFNNSASQATIVVIQNTTDAPARRTWTSGAPAVPCWRRPR